jgi:hypothetical protein
MELPDLSVATQLTCVVPIGKVLPDRGVHTGATVVSTLSVAVALNCTTAPRLPLFASTVWFAGTLSTGAVLSVTVTLNRSATVLFD